MSSLHEELVARAASTRCLTCRFLSTLKPSDRTEWETELKLPSITNEAFADAMRRRNIQIGPFAVRNHRRNHQ